MYLNKVISSYDSNVISSDLIEIADHRISRYINLYFNKVGIKFGKGGYLQQIKEFRKIYEERPVRDLTGRFGFNNLLLLY